MAPAGPPLLKSLSQNGSVRLHQATQRENLLATAACRDVEGPRLDQAATREWKGSLDQATPDVASYSPLITREVTAGPSP